MRRTSADEWSRGSTFLHCRAAAAKLAPSAVFLVVIATAHRRFLLLAAVMFLLLVAGLVAARLPVLAALSRAAAVLPFTILFAAVSFFAGDPARAWQLLLKSYLSALAVLLLVATTPLPDLLDTLEGAKVPRFLLSVVQFLYRYLFVVRDQAVQMRQAAACRGGMTFRAAGGALAVLFARSYARAESIQHAMTSRGFDGRFRPLAPRLFTSADARFAIIATLLPVLLRAAVEVAP